MKSCLPLCSFNRRTPEVETGTEREAQTAAVDGSAAVGESVYYDAREFLSDTGSPFVPLALSRGTSLDVPTSVVVRSPQVSKSDGQSSLHSRSSARRTKKAEGSKGRRPSIMIFRKKLEETHPVADLPMGFPGHLTETELEACLEFRKQLKEGDSVYRDMVYCYKEVEEEPYSVCRYLRSRNFIVDDTFQMMDKSMEIWKQGQAHDFFSDASVALGGAPESALLTQLPLVLGGIAQNGCPVLYLVTGQILAEGIECVTSLDNNIPNYVWYFVVHKLKRRVAAAQAEDPSRFVRVQLTVVVDLKDLSCSLLTRVLPVLEKVLSTLGVFPELLFNVVILNTPRFFTGFWPVIKKFMDPSTAKKFELYSNPMEGKKRLLELVAAKELASDYGGSAPSTSELVSQHAGSGVTHQIVRLLSSQRRGDVEFNFKLEEGENAVATVYTNATDGADVSLYRKGDKDCLSQVTMTRVAGEQDDKAFSRELDTSLHGPGSYRITMKRQPGSPTSHYVVLGDVSQK